jgi:hypothetical protein
VKVTHGLSKVPETIVTRQKVFELKMKCMDGLEYNVLEFFLFLQVDYYYYLWDNDTNNLRWLDKMCVNSRQI